MNQPLKLEPVATPPMVSSSAVAAPTSAVVPEAGTYTPKPASGDASDAADGDWESERKLVSSLWMLQKMEAKVRTCLRSDLVVVLKL